MTFCARIVISCRSAPISTKEENMDRTRRHTSFPSACVSRSFVRANASLRDSRRSSYLWNRCIPRRSSPMPSPVYQARRFAHSEHERQSADDHHYTHAQHGLHYEVLLQHELMIWLFGPPAAGRSRRPFRLPSTGPSNSRCIRTHRAIFCGADRTTECTPSMGGSRRVFAAVFLKRDGPLLGPCHLGEGAEPLR